jgi:hypothetical protein
MLRLAVDRTHGKAVSLDRSQHVKRYFGGRAVGLGHVKTSLMDFAGELFDGRMIEAPWPTFHEVRKATRLPDAIFWKNHAPLGMRQ